MIRFNISTYLYPANFKLYDVNFIMPVDRTLPTVNRINIHVYTYIYTCRNIILLRWQICISFAPWRLFTIKGSNQLSVSYNNMYTYIRSQQNFGEYPASRHAIGFVQASWFCRIAKSTNYRPCCLWTVLWWGRVLVMHDMSFTISSFKLPVLRTRVLQTCRDLVMKHR